MRGKRAKLLRKLAGKFGLAKAEIKNQTGRDWWGNRVVITFRYPDNSFQRVYKDMKKGIGIQ